MNDKIMQAVLRAGLCVVMFSSASLMFAQNETDDTETETAVAAPAKKAAARPTDNYVKKAITGYVYDAATKEPLAGAQVQALADPRYAAMTDEDGSYTIMVPEFVSALYVFCPDYNGVQIAIHGDKNQNANLYSVKVDNAYRNGTDLSIAHRASIRNSSAVTIENDIENKLNASVRTITRGGMIGQGSALFIDGLNSLNANSQPLVVVDGVIWDMQYNRGTLHDGFVNSLFNIIDPEDIDDVEVIKNGTSLYGARGANGVLVIKTKRGTSQATRINVRIYGGYEMTPSTIKMMNGEQYRNYVTEYAGTTPTFEQNGRGDYTSIPFLNDDKNSFFYNLYHNNTDWSKDLYKGAFTQNYRVNVQGGDDVALYNLSLGYTKGDATAQQNDFNRLNIRFNTDINLFTNLKTALDISYVRTAYNIYDNGWASDYTGRHISAPNVLGLIQAPSISRTAHYIVYENGQNILKPSNDMSGKNYTDATNPFTFAEALGGSALPNPYWILENGEGDNKNYQEQTQFLINVAPEYKINDNWKIGDCFSYSIDRTNEKYYVPNNGVPEIYVEGLGTIQSIVSSQFAKETTLFNDFNINWNQKFGGHNFNVVGGFRFSSYTYTISSIKGYGNTSDKMPNISGGLQYKSSTGLTENWKNLAYYLMADYNYKNRYFLNAGVTMETSSRFGSETKEGIKLAGVKWGLFPTVQAAWVMSAEPWFTTTDAINYLKLNVSYTESGNDDIDSYASTSFLKNVTYLQNATGLIMSNIENPRIQWETTRRISGSVQANFLNNRLMMGVEVYRSKTDNLLTKKTVSDITGFSDMWSNDGALKNIGAEVSVNAVLLNKKDWVWQAGFSVGHYKNTITDLPEGTEMKLYALDATGKETGDPTIIKGYTSSIYGENNILTAVGKSAGVFYGYKTAGVFSTDEEAQSAGKYGYLRYPTGLADASKSYRNFQAGDVHFIDQNGDGWISEADMVEIGDPNPDIYGNFFTSLTWKNLTLDVLFKYSLGNDVFNYQRMQLESGNSTWNQTTAVVNRWTHSGQITNVPRTVDPNSSSWVNNERFSDRWIEDGSYLKLKKVRLSYRIPVSASWLQGLAVWGEANNVFTVSKYLGVDPEVSCGNSVLYQGIDAGYLPQSRNFNLGVTINL